MGGGKGNKKKSQKKGNSQKAKTRDQDNQIELGMQSSCETVWGLDQEIGSGNENQSKETFLKEDRKPPLKAKSSKNALQKKGHFNALYRRSRKGKCRR